MREGRAQRSGEQHGQRHGTVALLVQRAPATVLALLVGEEKVIEQRFDDVQCSRAFLLRRLVGNRPQRHVAREPQARLRVISRLRQDSAVAPQGRCVGNSGEVRHIEFGRPLQCLLDSQERHVGGDADGVSVASEHDLAVAVALQCEERADAGQLGHQPFGADARHPRRIVKALLASHGIVGQSVPHHRHDPHEFALAQEDWRLDLGDQTLERFELVGLESGAHLIGILKDRRAALGGGVALPAVFQGGVDLAPADTNAAKPFAQVDPCALIAPPQRQQGVEYLVLEDAAQPCARLVDKHGQDVIVGPVFAGPRALTACPFVRAWHLDTQRRRVVGVIRFGHEEAP